MSEGVVLLHGIFRTRYSMRGLEKFLNQSGYETLNIGYRSTKRKLEEIVEDIHPAIDAFATQHERLHFVGYSMGGLIIRAYLNKHRPHNLSRVVMLGTPNGGSEVADFVASWGLYKFSYGPAGQQLITNKASFSHLFGPVDFDLGILAGTRNYDPLAAWIIKKPNDGKVSIESTKLANMKAHALIDVSHTWFPHHRPAWEHTVKFLREGIF